MSAGNTPPFSPSDELVSFLDEVDSLTGAEWDYPNGAPFLQTASRLVLFGKQELPAIAAAVAELSDLRVRFGLLPIDSEVNTELFRQILLIRRNAPPSTVNTR